MTEDAIMTRTAIGAGITAKAEVEGLGVIKPGANPTQKLYPLISVFQNQLMLH